MNITTGTRTIRLDAKTSPASVLFFWTCEHCGEYGQARGSRNVTAAADFGRVHAQLCANDFDVHVTITDTFSPSQAALAAQQRDRARKIGA